MNVKIKKFINKTSSVLLIIGLLASIFTITLPTNVLLASDRVKPEWQMPKHYPDGFDGWGTLNRIDSESIIVDDTQMPLSKFAVFNTPDSTNVRFSWFHEGDKVGYILDKKSNLVESVWLITMQ